MTFIQKAKKRQKEEIYKKCKKIKWSVFTKCNVKDQKGD